MPLPKAGIQWPPLELATLAPEMEIWSAWYSGSPEHLEAAYQHERRHGHHQGVPTNRPSTYRGGVVGALARTFWGSPRVNLNQPKAKLHVPLAGDICQASADLLFSDPPTLTVEDKTTQDRLAELADDGLFSTLAEAAELCAALGGTYLRVTWDKDTVPDGPFPTAVDADGAWPEFQWGRLKAVTFWTDVTPPLDRAGDKRIRHLERHEIATDGNGVILHGLYEGTRINLGRPIPLTEAPDLAGIADELDDGDTIDTLSPGLAVVYVPNQRPQRLWRHDPVGRNLGRSDLQGVEGLMDALDETYTSWMRDIRLGKARIFAAETALQSLGSGNGAAFDADQEVYTPLNLLAKPSDGGSGLPIQAEQFAIRYAEHSATAQDLVTQILRTAGYSTQTFGDGDGGVADRTATEVQARQQRSYMTRDRKVRLWRPAIGQLVEKLLAVDAAVFDSGVKPARPTVGFSDGVQESQISIAQTAQALYAAEAASTKTLVKMVHPDWDDTQVDTEVTLIQAEKASAAAVHVADPFGTGGEPHLPLNQ